MHTADDNNAMVYSQEDVTKIADEEKTEEKSTNVMFEMAQMNDSDEDETSNKKENDSRNGVVKFTNGSLDRNRRLYSPMKRLETEIIEDEYFPSDSPEDEEVKDNVFNLPGMARLAPDLCRACW